MPSKSADVRYGRVRRGAELLLLAVIVAFGWTHGVLYVEGGSMEPALSAGDVIVYRRVRVVPERGDLIVFEHGGTLVVHRVAGLLHGGAMRTRGDANESSDATPVEAGDVRGEVLFVLPSGKAASRVAASFH
ncbi:MAG: signal peptidase I [Coriobacteriia bacterium]|nr:signal peptidase I [Coriobacteriia bacterium]